MRTEYAECLTCGRTIKSTDPWFESRLCEDHDLAEAHIELIAGITDPQELIEYGLNHGLISEEDAHYYAASDPTGAREYMLDRLLSI